MTPFKPDWNRVIAVMQERFPRELEVAMMTVRIEELETAAVPQPVDDSVDGRTVDADTNQ